ncbi:MAG TPA: pantetheine-phosphate adenylyltransferase [Candidatus Latescibacteria bacterium]|nr:pantetheine-phosphate adenylyltransferase [Candidatus Latescibacterota bacterium]
MEVRLRKALYPGTFDPITYGHLDIIERAMVIFDHVIVIVACNPGKTPLFSLEERLDMVRETTQHWEKVSVDRFEGLLVDAARLKGVHAVIRGLRAVTDFEYEFQMALTNRSLDPRFESVFLMTSSEYTYLNSTIVKEIARFGGDVSRFVPPYVEGKLKEKLRTDIIRHAER